MNDSRTLFGNVKAVSSSVKAEAAAKARTRGNFRDPEELHQTIAVVAYYLAEHRHFEPGHEMEDWLKAEGEVLLQKEALKGLPA